jgi:adenylate cyclase
MLDLINTLLRKLIGKLSQYSSRSVRWTLVIVLGLLSSIQIIKDRDHSLVNSSYDTLLEYRVLTPKVDPSILILDIDERSLDEMRAEYGRWPWPRETLAEVLVWLERQGVKAVVFDILFADQDTLNPLSDLAFAKAIEQSQTSFFPILRLDPENDPKSEVRARMLQGFAKHLSNPPLTQGSSARPTSEAAPHVAVIPPVFESIIRTQRMGYHNIYPDPDGINRTYRLWEDISDWRLHSLPMRMALHFNWRVPNEPDQILKFSKESMSHRNISFIDVWKHTQKNQAPPPWVDDLKGAIVIIGSTAPSLLDIKVTPISPIHPGVHVLATAIDNLKNQGFQREFPLWFKLVQCWVFLLAMAWLSKAISITALRWAILFVPSAFLFISYVSLQAGPLFLDFSLAASQAVLFFSLLTLYFSLRLQHFTTAAGSFIEPKGFEAFYVIFHKDDERVKPQAMLDQLQALRSERLVMQSGWIGYELEKRLGPTFIWLRASEKTTIEKDMDEISKMHFLSADVAWQSEIMRLTRGWEGESEMLHFAWLQVGKAFHKRDINQ